MLPKRATLDQILIPLPALEITEGAVFRLVLGQTIVASAHCSPRKKRGVQGGPTLGEPNRTVDDGGTSGISQRRYNAYVSPKHALCRSELAPRLLPSSRLAASSGRQR